MDEFLLFLLVSVERVQNKTVIIIEYIFKNTIILNTNKNVLHLTYVSMSSMVGLLCTI